MDIIKTLHLWHRFERKNEAGEVIGGKDALQDVSIGIEQGSFVAVIGHNGSGKSTMARHLNALLQPTRGTVIVDGKDTGDDSATLAIRQKAGMVFQNPDNQIIADIVEEDVAFGPENLGVPTKEIWTRVAQSLKSAGIADCRLSSPRRLSGGQKQRVAIAGILAMKPSCMILDEPTAMLDPSGRESVLKAVLELNRTEGITIILITHDMNEAAMADRILVMDQGNVVMDGAPGEVFSDLERLKDLQIPLPPAAELALELVHGGMPLEGEIIGREQLTEAVAKVFAKERSSESGVDSGRESGRESGDVSSDSLKASQKIRPLTPLTHSNAILRLEHVSFDYGAGLTFETHALKDVSLSIEEGQVTGLIGPTGSGKSTLLQHLNGLLTPSSGRVFFREQDISGSGFSASSLCRKVGMVFQYPEYQLFGMDVLSDVMFGPLNTGMSQEEAQASAREALLLMGIGETDFSKSPFELSGGQKRRAAIAGVLAMHPDVLVLDEPMAGLDQAGQYELTRQLLHMKDELATTIVWSSHSMEDMARYADHLLVMSGGELVRSGSPRDVFAEIDYLESIGLAPSEAVYVIRDLKSQGLLPEDAFAITAEEAAQVILKTYRG